MSAPAAAPLKVAHLLLGAEEGGAEEFFLNLLSALQKRGVRQTAYISPHPPREAALAAAGVPVETLTFEGYIRNYLSMRTLRRSVAAFAPHVFLAWMNRAGRRALKGPWVTAARLGGYYPLKNYRRCEELIVNTPGIAGFAKDAGWPEAKLHMLSNFASLPAAEAIDPSAYFAQSTGPIALALCRLHPSKGVDALLRALKAGPEQVRLLIAGDGPERSRLEALAADLSLAGRTAFLGWRRDRRALLEACDFVVHPARHEPLGNVVLEAWLAGKPIVAARSEGPSWLIEDDRTGLLVEPDDPTGLAAAMETLAGDTALRDRLAAAGLNAYRARFSEDAIAGSYIDVFTEWRDRLSAGRGRA